ncbi:MAG: hypothetical protein M3Y59_18675 [Myxococcota bacterium]|nr:hypothetical protein [Myxococcota bacterium]
MDFARHQHLHTIIMLRDVIRKWWRCELSFKIAKYALEDPSSPPPEASA